MKRVIKIALIFIIIILICSYCTTIYADGIEALNGTDPEAYTNPNANLNSPEFQARVKIVLGIIRGIGIISSVLALMIMGIKYMLGSLEEKAEYKKKFPIYALGLTMVVAITVLPTLIYNFMTNL